MWLRRKNIAETTWLSACVGSIPTPRISKKGKMISKTKISKRIKKKTNSNLVETILLAKKYNQEIASLLASPTRRRIRKNLDEIDKEAKEGETIIVPGKVLGQGSINKKIKVVALSFSESAKEKLKKAKCETVQVKEEFEKSKKINGRILK